MPAIETAVIIGGGIAGLASAIALKQKGIEVEVVEIATADRASSAGLVISGHMMHAMARLGIADTLLKGGFAFKGLRVLNTDGYVTDEMPGRGEAPFPADLGVARAALRQALAGKVQALGIPLRSGVTFSQIEDRGAGVEVAFSDATAGRYDLVIGADGNHSRVRRVLFGEEARPKFTGQGVWRYNVARPGDLEWAEIYLGGANAKAGYVPMAPDLMYVLALTAEPGNPQFPPETLAREFRKRLEGYGGLLGDIRDNDIIDPAQVAYHPLEASLLPAPWYKGRVVLIGDAAHCAAPYLGQGATMAVEDALVLSEELGRETSVAGALRAFMDRRAGRAGSVPGNTIQLGEWEIYCGPDSPARAAFRTVAGGLAPGMAALRDVSWRP